jgi:RNA polymerase sigma-70 factor (ECF subfamily)
LTKELHENVCDEIIFKGLYNKYAAELHDYLYYKYGEQCNPKDKAQDAFIKLWENCKKVLLTTARGFLYKVASNMVLNDIKHQKVVLRYQQEKPQAHTIENPEFLMEKEQYFKMYQQALAKLSEDQRVAFMLNKVEGKKHEEIAQLIGVTRKVVEYRIYSAFSILKTELENFRIK